MNDNDIEYSFLDNSINNINDINTLPEIIDKTDVIQGIYFFCNTDKVYYIGQSTDIKNRICGHTHKFIFDKHTCKIKILKVIEQDIRLKLEKCFIDRFKPIYNNCVFVPISRTIYNKFLKVLDRKFLLNIIDYILENYIINNKSVAKLQALNRETRGEQP